MYNVSMIIPMKVYQNKKTVFLLDFQNQSVECGIPRTAQNTIQKRIIGGRIAV